MSTSTFQLATPATLIEGLPAFLNRVPRKLRLLASAGALLLAAQQFALALQTPGELIRDQLGAAGASVRELSWAESPERVQQAVGGHFRGRTVSVNPAQFPAQVAVTLRGLDRATCLDAQAAARRAEGLVVIALEGYGAADDCSDSNDMTWRLMP
jgi:hypothetical protein